MAAFATVGDNCIDRFLPPVGDWLVGGNAVNVAVQLALLGRRASYFGAVGDDPSGQLVRKALISNSVGIDGLTTMAGQHTAFTDIATDADGERHFIFEDFGACGLYQPSIIDIEGLRHMNHVHIGWLNDGGGLKRALRGLGPSVSQDLSVNAGVENLSPESLDIAFCSAPATEAAHEAQRLLQCGVRLAVVTMGAAGSLACDGRNTVFADAPAIMPFDTTGAGDAFIAGFLDYHVAGRNVQDCLGLATVTAGRACKHRGGFPQRALPPEFTEK